jgi:hypothetical protein
MKTTIEVSDALLEQAKQAAKEQGISLRTLFERGLHLALQPRAKPNLTPWPDLSFKPQEGGALVPANQWREQVNEVPGWTPK